jgi:hypothetical protein
MTKINTVAPGPKELLMRLHTLIRRHVCLLTVAVLLASQAMSAFAADPVPSDRRLPPGTLGYVSCPNVPRMVSQFRETSFGQMLQDPELEEIRSQLVGMAGPLVQDFEDRVGMPLSDLAALFSGEVTLAAVRPVGQSLGYVTFLDIGEHRDILDRMLANVDDRLEDRSATKTTETRNGTEITIYSVPRDNPDTPPYTTAYFVKDSMFVVGSTVSLLESVLNRWDGEHTATFADTPVYGEVMAKCRSGADAQDAFRWFVSPIELVTAGLTLNPEYQMVSIMMNAYLPTLGLNRFKGIGGVLELSTEEFDSVYRSMIYAEPPATGVLKVFQFRPTVEGPPAWVPADAAQFFALDWNVAGAYDAVESIYDAFTGQPGQFERMLNQLGGPGQAADLHPKRDIIDAFSGTVYGYLIPSEEDDPADMRGVLAIGVTDEDKGRRLLEEAVKSAGGSTAEARGTTVYHLSGEDSPGVAAIHAGQIFIADNLERLGQALEGKVDNPLAESPRFQQVQARIPETVSILSYQDASDQLQTGYEALRSGNFDGLTQGAFDFSVLPPFDAISKYFRPTASYVIPDENGAITVQFTLKAEE